MHKYQLGDVVTLKAAVVGAGDTERRFLPKVHILARITHEDIHGTALTYRGRVIRADDVIEQNYRDFLEEELAGLPQDYLEEEGHEPVTHQTIQLTPETARELFMAYLEMSKVQANVKQTT
jgi:hypothetical protein